jgi:hypothetical protein
MPPTPTITAKLAEALRDLRSASISRPSCQLHAASRCCCFSCAYERSAEVLAAYAQHTEAQAAEARDSNCRHPGQCHPGHCPCAEAQAATVDPHHDTHLRSTGWPFPEGEKPATPAPVEQAAQPVAPARRVGMTDEEIDQVSVTARFLGLHRAPLKAIRTFARSIETRIGVHPQRGSEPLTHMQIVMLWGHRSDGPTTPEIVSFARAIEAAHGIPSSNGEQA